MSGDVVEQEDVQRFQYFGNMLLHQGGELGYHGYNHQPLSLSNVDYANILPYKTWESYECNEKSHDRADTVWKRDVSGDRVVCLCTAV